MIAQPSSPRVEPSKVQGLGADLGHVPTANPARRGFLRQGCDEGPTESTDAQGHIREIDVTHWVVEMARKGGVPASRVLNCLTLRQLLEHLRRRKPGACRLTGVTRLFAPFGVSRRNARAEPPPVHRRRRLRVPMVAAGTGGEPGNRGAQQGSGSRHESKDHGRPPRLADVVVCLGNHGVDAVLGFLRCQSRMAGGEPHQIGTIVGAHSVMACAGEQDARSL